MRANLVDDDEQPAPLHVKVTIELTGEGGRVSQFLDALRRVLDEQPATPPGPGAADSSWWTPDRAATFVRRLKPPALHALRIIAESAPKVRVSVVQREMQRAGLPVTPGGLSSIGFAVRGLGSPPPFIRDNYQRVYLMDPSVATVLLGAIEDEYERRRS